MSLNQIVSPTTENVQLEIRRTPITAVSEEVDGASGITSGNTTTRTINNVLVSNVSQTNQPQTIRRREEPKKRKKWSLDMNLHIMRLYYKITNNETDVSNYRTALHEAFSREYPNFPVTIQNLADQRRAIVKNNYIPQLTLEQLKNELSKTINPLPEDINNTPPNTLLTDTSVTNLSKTTSQNKIPIIPQNSNSSLSNTPETSTDTFTKDLLNKTPQNKITTITQITNTLSNRSQTLTDKSLNNLSRTIQNQINITDNLQNTYYNTEDTLIRASHEK